MRIRRPAQTKILKCFNLQTERACKQSFAPLLTKPGIIVEVYQNKSLQNQSHRFIFIVEGREIIYATLAYKIYHIAKCQATPT